MQVEVQILGYGKHFKKKLIYKACLKLKVYEVVVFVTSIGLAPHVCARSESEKAHHLGS